MNKNFLSLALIAAFSISSLVIATDPKKDAKNVSSIPEHIQNMQKNILEAIERLEENAKKVKGNLDQEQDKKSKLDAGQKDENLEANITKLTKELSELQLEIADAKEAQKIIASHFDDKFNKSLMHKVTAPVRSFGKLLANNKIAGLVFEVTGIAGLSYVIYKSFFAQEEVDEDTL